MALSFVRPSQLPPRPNPQPTEVVPSDNGQPGNDGVAGVTWEQGVNAGRPLATQAEAIAGVQATHAMTPLTTKQAGDVNYASAAQGAKADSAVQSIVAGANVTVDATNPQNPIVSSIGVPDGSITPAKISNNATDQQGIAFKIGAVSTASYTIYVDAATGNDTTGDGSIVTPFATPQRAWDSLPATVYAQVTISIANGTYSTSSRAPSAMQRPALIYCDLKKMGMRTDGPGGVMVGSVVFRGASKAGVILQPAASYTRGIYATGAPGSIAFQNMTFELQPGSESGIVAHRGSYVHASDIEIDGNSTATYGVIAEAGGYFEGLNMDVHHVQVGGQTFSKSFLQFALNSTIHDCSIRAIACVKQSEVSIAVGASITGDVLVKDDSWFESAGTSTAHCVINGIVDVRDGSWTAVFTDALSTINTYPGSSVEGSELRWSASWFDYGGALYLPGCKSFVAPATQSTVVTPLAFLGEVRRLFVDATFELRNNTGNLVAENFGAATATIAANGATIPITLQGKHTPVNITAAAGRTGVLLPQFQSGRLANTPFPDGAQVTLVAASGTSSIQISPGTTSVLEGGTVTIGTGTGLRNNLTFIYSGSRGVWICLRGDANP